MQIFVKNLGPLRAAQWSPRNLNVITGPNGSGKTYLAHAIYLFLKGISDSRLPRSIRGTNSMLDPIAAHLSEHQTIELSFEETVNIVKKLIEYRSVKSTLAFEKYLNISSDLQEEPIFRVLLGRVL